MHYFDTPVNEFMDGKEFPSIDGCRILVVNVLNGTGYEQTRMAGGAMSSINPAGEKIVVITSELLEKVGKDVAEVVMYHELGHHYFGDIAEANTKVSPGDKPKYIRTDEARADSYAVQKFGKKRVREALKVMAPFWGETVLKNATAGKVLFTIFCLNRILKVSF